MKAEQFEVVLNETVYFVSFLGLSSRCTRVAMSCSCPRPGPLSMYQAPKPAKKTMLARYVYRRSVCIVEFGGGAMAKSDLPFGCVRVCGSEDELCLGRHGYCCQYCCAAHSDVIASALRTTATQKSTYIICSSQDASSSVAFSSSLPPRSGALHQHRQSRLPCLSVNVESYNEFDSNFQQLSKVRCYSS